MQCLRFKNKINLQKKKLWYMYTMEYHSAIKRNTFVLVLMRWMNVEPIIQSKVSQRKTNIVY